MTQKQVTPYVRPIFISIHTETKSSENRNDYIRVILTGGGGATTGSFGPQVSLLIVLLLKYIHYQQHKIMNKMND